MFLSRSLRRLGTATMQDCINSNAVMNTARCEREIGCISTILERTLSGSHASCSGATNGSEELQPGQSPAVLGEAKQVQIIGACAEVSGINLPAGVRMFSITGVSQRPESETGSATPPSELNPLLQAPPPGADGAGSVGSRVSSHGPGKAGAKLRGIAMSPKKINLFATLIRRMHVDDALAQCRLHPKKAGKIIAGVIVSAKANAENNHGMDGSKLAIDTINVGSGQHLRKMWIHGRGKSSVRRMYRTNMEVVLAETDRGARMRYVTPLLERQRKRIEPPQAFSRPRRAAPAIPG